MTAPTVVPAGQDLIHARRHPLDPIFAPRSVAVIGATETPGAVGRTLLWNLISSPFGGTVFPVNPKRASCLGIKAYPSVKAIGEPIDLAVVITPAPTVPNIVGQCADLGIPGAIVISAGFKEMGPPGLELERQVLAEARRGNMRLVGPNCLGVMSPLSGLNATFAAAMARPGNVAFLSQSGALCTAVLDWSLHESVGFSAFVSIGSMLDVDWGDLIDYLGNDPRTQSIVLYMESIGDARSFLSAAREVALAKPIIVIKAGRTEAAAKAAASHTGSLTGSDEVLDVAFHRVGVLRVNSIAEVFNMAEILGKQPRPAGPRLTILTNAGGPGVLATDALITSGGKLAPLSEATQAALNEFLPPAWSHNNPIDILGDADAERYARALAVCAKDENSDGLLVILTPQAMTEPTQTAQRLAAHARSGKPILASWMGGDSVHLGDEALSVAGIPTFVHPDEAARAFHYMWRYTYAVNGLYETPALAIPDGQADAIDRPAAAALIDSVRAENRTLMTEVESKALLTAYGIPTVPTILATTAPQAIAAARRMGFPAVVKLYSKTITHKTDVGGVKLNLPDEAAVEAAYREIETSVARKAGREHFHGVTVQPMIKLDGYELILGASPDEQFGPVLLFGTGGQLVEVFRDRALGLPPLSATLARRMMEQTRVYTALQGVRGRKPCDIPAIERILIRFSQLIVEQRWIKELDINPLLASPDQLIALDARVVLYDKATAESALPRLAIRPYPAQYGSTWKLPNGPELSIRPIRPEDEPLVAAFHETLSERTVRQRYFQPLSLEARIAHQRLVRVCFTDYDREIALVALHGNAKTDRQEIVAIGRLSKQRFADDVGEVTLVVADAWQHQGLGAELMRRMIAIARDEKLTRLTARLVPDNAAMAQLCQRAEFDLTPDASGNFTMAQRNL